MLCHVNVKSDREDKNITYVIGGGGGGGGGGQANTHLFNVTWGRGKRARNLAYLHNNKLGTS